MADRGNNPPRTDPYFVPPEVGKLIHAEARSDLLACVRFAGHLSKLQNRKVALPGFVGSPAHCWSHCFLFPPLPGEIGGHKHPGRPAGVAWNCSSSASARSGTLCKKYGVTFDLECHPSERAMGDIESASDYINLMDKAGYEGVVGFNLDGSHMEWQNVSVVAVHPRVRGVIHCAHVKGVWVAREHCRAGRLGGHRPMGHWANGWNFVTAGTARDANSLEEIFIELNRVGFDGAVSHRVGRQRRRAARRREGGAGELPQGRPAAERHAARRDAQGLGIQAVRDAVPALRTASRGPSVPPASHPISS